MTMKIGYWWKLVAADDNGNGGVYNTFVFNYICAFEASIFEEAKITVCVKKMKGVPNSTLLLDNGAVDFPLVSYTYSVSYEFLDEGQKQKNVSKSFLALIYIHIVWI